MYDKSFEVTYESHLDETMQPALFLRAKGDEPRPLVVALHTWSCDLSQPWDKFRTRCEERNYHLIYPLFRGPNNNRKACGSDLVVSDLESAVDYCVKNYPVDEKRIYLVGGSGGGHASLLMAGRAPQLWTAVSSWCPISDIKAWHKECRDAGLNYYKNIELSCDGDPQSSTSASAQAKRRSPLTYLEAAKGRTIVDIGTGIHDGHTGSVPVSHTLNAYNCLAAEEDRIAKEDIDYMVSTEKIPEHLKYTGPEDPAYGPYKVLLRKVSGMVRLTIFEGGHDLLPGPAFGFLERQVRDAAPVWNSGDHYDPETDLLGK